MNRAIAALFALLIGSSTLAAQAVDGYHPQKIDKWPVLVQKFVTVYANQCPVGMRAQHAPDGGLVAVAPGRSAERGLSQRLRLTLANPKSVRIVSARVTFHGLDGKARFTPIDSSADDAADQTRTLEVAFNDGSVKETWRDLSVPGFASVTRVDLESVIYADGSIWNAGSVGCHIVPDPLMLVSTR
jgi:hypothetical protein